MNFSVNIVVGSCLRKHREQRELSQRELATLMGKPQSFVSKIETGERKLSLFEIYDYALALDEDEHVIIEEIRTGLTHTGYLSE